EAQGRIYVSPTGKRYKKYYLDEARATIDGLWTDLPGFGTRSAAKEHLGYPGQKPEALLERILLASSRPGDVVADLFAGTGTTLVVAQRLGRRWLGCDLSPLALQACRRRLSALDGAALEIWWEEAPAPCGVEGERAPVGVEARREGRAVRLRLVGLPQGPGAPAGGPGDGPPLVEGWAVDGEMAGVFRPLWHTFGPVRVQDPPLAREAVVPSPFRPRGCGSRWPTGPGGSTASPRGWGSCPRAQVGPPWSRWPMTEGWAALGDGGGVRRRGERRCWRSEECGKGLGGSRL